MKMTNKLSLSKKDIVLILITLLALAILITKSVFFDEYKPVVNEELNLSIVTQHIEKTYDGFLYEKGILKIRLIDFKTHEDVQNIRLRRYFLGLVPMGDIYDSINLKTGE